MSSIIDKNRNNTQTFRFGVNRQCRDKTPIGGFQALTNGQNWKTLQGDAQQLAELVGQGFTFMPGLLGGQNRAKSNITGAQCVALDIDENLSIHDAIADEFIQRHCALIYTSHSHQKGKGSKPACDRFRLVFVLPEFIIDTATYEDAVKLLHKQIPNADPACKDASRFYYGNSEAWFPLVNPGATLPVDWVDRAIAVAETEREERERRQTEWNDHGDLDNLIQQALEAIPPRQPGSGNYPECIRVAMAVHSHYGDRAEEILEQWSPSIPGTSWNIPRKIRSFKRGGIGIGTLFAIAKQYGFEFPDPSEPLPHSGSKIIPKDRWWQKFRRDRDVSSLLEYTKRYYNRSAYKYVKQRGKLPDKPKFKPHIERELVGKLQRRFPVGVKVAYNEQTARVTGYIAPATLMLDTGESIEANAAKVITIAAPQPSIDSPLATMRWLASLQASSSLTLQYRPGNLPNRKTYASIGSPAIECTSDLHFQCIREARKKGWQTILDNTDMGLGKSSHYGEIPLSPLKLGFPLETNSSGEPRKRLWFLSRDHRNPTRPEPERYFQDFVAQHGGLVQVRDSHGDIQRTPLGRPQQRRPRRYETPDSNATCINYSAFEAARDRGIPISAGKDSPICQKCPHLANKDCPFLTQRARQLSKEAFLRAHIDQLPASAIEGDAAIVDEPSDMLTSTITLEVDNIADIAQAVKRSNRRLAQALEPLTDAIWRLVADPELPHYGLEHNDALAKIAEGLDWSWLPCSYTTLASKVDDPARLIKINLRHSLSRNSTGFTHLNEATMAFHEILASGWGGIFEGTPSSVELAARMSANIFPNWFSKFIKVLQGRAAVRIEAGNLKLITRNTRQQKILHKLAFAIYLDATMDRRDLAMEIGKSPSEILVVRRQKPSYPNISIKCVSGFGKVSRQRRDGDSGMQTRINAAVREICNRGEGKVYLCDRRDKNENYSEIKNLTAGWYGNHNRGNDAWKDGTDYIAVGLPFPNFGAKQDEYRALGGDPNSGGFHAWVNRQVEAETIQFIGRARAHHRPGDTIQVWLLADRSPSAIARLKRHFQHATFEKTHAYEITAAAADRTYRVRRQIFEAMGRLLGIGNSQAPGIQNLADEVGVTKGRISQIAKSLGFKGFRAFRESLVSLIESNKAILNSPIPPDDDLMALVESMKATLAEARREAGSRNAPEWHVVSRYAAKYQLDWGTALAALSLIPGAIEGLIRQILLARKVVPRDLDSGGISCAA